MSSNESDTKSETRDVTVENMDDLVDDWGDSSFPASDPPGSIPPSMQTHNPAAHSTSGDENTADDRTKSGQ